MIRSFRYPLYPTPTQERALVHALSACCELYNAALQERKDSYERTGKSRSLYDQINSIPEVRELRSDIADIGAAVLRGPIYRLERAFQAFFRRCRSGEKPGYPRFQSYRRYDTLDIEGLARTPVVAGDSRIRVPLVGKVKFKLTRPLLGTPYAMRISRKAGRWWVVVQCKDVPEKHLPESNETVGIDLGLRYLVVTSDGDFFANPRAIATAERSFRLAQRRVGRRKKGSNRRQKAVLLLHRKHEHVANARKEASIRIARILIAKYGTICLEDVNLKGLSRSFLSKSFHDASWGVLLHWIHVKAEEAAREVVKVDPRGTSQDCSACGKAVKKSLSERVHVCSCGLTLDRDVNAAKNVLSRGRRDRGGRVGSRRPVIREDSAEFADANPS